MRPLLIQPVDIAAYILFSVYLAQIIQRLMLGCLMTKELEGKWEEATVNVI
jgi:hypothetical protein